MCLNFATLVHPHNIQNQNKHSFIHFEFSASYPEPGRCGNCLGRDSQTSTSTATFSSRSKKKFTKPKYFLHSSQKLT